MNFLFNLIDIAIAKAKIMTRSVIPTEKGLKHFRTLETVQILFYNFSKIDPRPQTLVNG